MQCTSSTTCWMKRFPRATPQLHRQSTKRSPSFFFCVKDSFGVNTKVVVYSHVPCIMHEHSFCLLPPFLRAAKDDSSSYTFDLKATLLRSMSSFTYSLFLLSCYCYQYINRIKALQILSIRSDLWFLNDWLTYFSLWNITARKNRCYALPPLSLFLYRIYNVIVYLSIIYVFECNTVWNENGHFLVIITEHMRMDMYEISMVPKSININDRVNSIPVLVLCVDSFISVFIAI